MTFQNSEVSPLWCLCSAPVSASAHYTQRVSGEHAVSSPADKSCIICPCPIMQPVHFQCKVLKVKKRDIGEVQIWNLFV